MSQPPVMLDGKVRSTLQATVMAIVVLVASVLQIRARPLTLDQTFPTSVRAQTSKVDLEWSGGWHRATWGKLLRRPAVPPAPSRTTAHTPPKGGVVRVVSVGGDAATKTLTPEDYVERVKQLIRDKFGARSEPALRVASCESVRYRRDVVFGPSTGSAGERGVFQIHPGHFDGRWGRPWLPERTGLTWSDMFVPKHNITVAYELSEGGTDWEPWTCRP